MCLGVTRWLKLMKERKPKMPKLTKEEREKAKEAKAIYHVKRIVLVNTEKLDEYIELMCADDPSDF